MAEGREAPFVVDEATGETQRRKEERERRARVSVADKTTAASRASGTTLRFTDLTTSTPPVAAIQEQQQGSVLGEQRAAGGSDREATSVFIEKKREMFLIEYQLQTKRDEMARMEHETAERERRLEAEEHNMEEELARFESETKELTLRAMEATKRAEAETKTKLERQTEVKRLALAIASIKSELAKLDERLDDCRRYKAFLDGLAPATSSTTTMTEMTSEGRVAFEEPEQLLAAFKALEKRNLFLINHNQETERVLEDLRQKRAEVEQKMGGEIVGLQAQIRRLESDIAAQRERQAALRKQAESRLLQHPAAPTSMASTTSTTTKPKTSTTVQQRPDQEALLAELRAKVEEVYTRVVGENSAGMGALQMVASIERRIDELLAAKARLPADYVARAEGAKEKERRQKARDEKAEHERAEQQAKVQRAIERSQRPVPVRKGKPVMFRSYLPAKVDHKAVEEQRRREEEAADMRYFGLSPAEQQQRQQLQQGGVDEDDEEDRQS